MVSISRRGLVVGSVAVAAASVLGSRTVQAAISPALFVAAHPDDETLGMAVALAEHVAAGQDVHVLWLTRGEASGIRNVLNGATISSWWAVGHDPAAEGYAPLSRAVFGQARLTEATNAVRCLASGLPGTLILHEGGLPDGGVTQTSVEATIRAVADEIAQGGPVRLKTHTWLVDNHPDHLAAGAAARRLKAIDPRFADLRHYVLPPYWTDSRLSRVTEGWDLPANAGIRARAVNAYRSYGAWAPPHAFAVGHHSVPSQFATLTANPRCMVHS